MAKKTKDSNLSIEERLEQALIPNWDEPYKLPDNWCWVYLTKGFAQCLDSFRKPVNASERSKMQGDIPYYGATGQVGWINDFLTNDHLVLLGEDGAPFLDYEKNKAYVIKGKAWVNNHAHILKSFYGEDSNLYLMHYLNVFNYHGYVNGTTRLKLTQESMNSIPVPLAPIDEQQRIVARIESLFAKLDEAKENAQEVVNGFETRKAAILHKAFSGELTAKWREQNGVSIDNWTNVTISDVCKVNPPKINTKDLADDLEVSFFPMPALSEVYGEITEPQTRKLKLVKTGFTNFSEGDVVFAKITPCMENGKSAVIGKLVNNIGYGTTEFYVLRCNENLYNRYLYHLVRSKTFRDEAKCVMTGAVGQQRVPKSFIEEYNLNLPSFCEQEKIVSVLDSFFEREQKAKETAETTIEQIDTMKKAILARAFRGELGTNDPSEESAVELIKSIFSKNTGYKATKTLSEQQSLVIARKKTPLRYKILEKTINNAIELKVDSRKMALYNKAKKSLERSNSTLEKALVKSVTEGILNDKKQILLLGKTVHEREVLGILYKQLGSSVKIGNLITTGLKWSDMLDAVRSLEKTGIIERSGKDSFKLK